jgi:hypothetical protein
MMMMVSVRAKNENISGGFCCSLCSAQKKLRSYNGSSKKHSTAKAVPKERQQISLPKTTDKERGRDCIGISNPKAMRLTWRMPIGSLEDIVLAFRIQRP